MNKELKFWLLFALAIFAIAIVYQVVQTAANVANNTANDAASTLQSYAQIPGQLLQSFFNFIQNMFGGNSTGSNVTDQEDTLAEEGLSA
jgi:cell shape-determining protein MreC